MLKPSLSRKIVIGAIKSGAIFSAVSEAERGVGVVRCDADLRQVGCDADHGPEK